MILGLNGFDRYIMYKLWICFCFRHNGQYIFGPAVKKRGINFMSYLLIEPKVKAKAPNIALMKWARWCEINEYDYQYVRGKVVPDIKPERILMSCIFTFYSEIYKKTINYYRKMFPGVPLVVGGVFPTLNPKWFSDRWSQTLSNGEFEVTVSPGLHPALENIAPKYNVAIKYEDRKPPYPRDKIVLYSSRGCTNNCGYCVVPRLEGAMQSFKSIQHILDAGRNEIPDAKSVVLYDNNFTEHEYFDNIVDELVNFGLPIDIHGLHVESFTEHHAKRLANLKWAGQGKRGKPYLRFSFDKRKYFKDIKRAAKLAAKYNIKATFFCYMLFNYTDSPTDFWWRLAKVNQIVQEVGREISLFPQRYEPLNSLKRNQYIGPKWTEEMVRGLVRISTHLHGFFPETKNNNLHRWLKYSREEFLNNLIEASKNQKVEKFIGDIIYEIDPDF
jgi:hypothetical protein